MSEWLGSLVFVVLGLVTAIAGPAFDWPPVVWATVAILFVAGAVLTLPAGHGPAAERQSAFIVGDASGARLNNIDAEADVFIKGDAKNARIYDVLFRRSRRRWMRR